MRLSVLDQSPIPEGSTGADALRNTLDLARAADRLGCFGSLLVSAAITLVLLLLLNVI